MRILVTNDDGIFSPGIKALALALQPLGEVMVVAPDVEQSAVGHGITVRRPLRFKHTAAAGFGDIPAYRVDGTPADCVVLGVHLLGKPDLICSGINIGVNLGLDLTHSGTVAGALEGTSLGIPSIAFSQEVGEEEINFGGGARWVLPIARWVAQQKLPAQTLLNVNFPLGEPQGLAITHLSDHHWQDTLLERHDPEGKPYYWVAGRQTGQESEGTDLRAVRSGLVSVCPVTTDLTAYRFMETLRSASAVLNPG